MRRFALCVALAVLVAPSAAVTQAGAATMVQLSGSFPSSQLQINGDSDNDAITVSVADGVITVTDSNGIAETSPHCDPVDGISVTCAFDPPDPAPPAEPFAPVKRMNVSLGDGNDSFTNQNLVANGEIDGGTGDKVIAAGPGNQEIGNGPGNDAVDAGEGDDDVDGGGFPNGADAMSGGPGSDILTYFGFQGVTIALNGLPDDGRQGEGDNATAFESIGGTDADDSLAGDDAGTLLFGGDGNDTLSGLGGADVVIGGLGDDTLIGGTGPDSLQCGTGFDSVVAEPIDLVAGTCDRQGAVVAGEALRANSKGKAKLRVLCPVEEAFACVGQVALVSNGKQIGLGSFNVPPGVTAPANLKLTKKGRKQLAANDGELLVTAEARTQELAGVTVSAERVLLTGG